MATRSRPEGQATGFDGWDATTDLCFPRLLGIGVRLTGSRNAGRSIPG